MSAELILGIFILINIIICLIFKKKWYKQNKKIIRLVKENRFLELKYKHDKVNRIECPYKKTDIKTLKEDCSKYFKFCDGCIEISKKRR